MTNEITSPKRYYEMKEIPLFLSADDIADILGISRAYAYNLFYAKGFPTIKLGKRRLVRKEKFFTWLEEQEV